MAAGVDAGSVYSSIRIRLTQLDQDLKGVYARLDTMESRIKGATDPTAATKNFNLMALAGTGAFIAIGAAVKSAVGDFAGFEQSIANVASVSGGTAEEMAKLEDAARSAGETTRFTASQAADALYYLASAGLDATQSVAALDGVLQLAGATQSDLAFTSAALTATLSQFNLEAADATRVSNVFAAAIGNSQANMQKLADSMRYVGPVAGALGQSLEATTGALQVLYNAGFQGEQAGTILRNVLGDLANATGPVIAKLEKLGVAFADVDPTTHTLAESIGVLNAAGLTASDALAIFGDRAGPGLITLLQAGEDEIQKYTDDVTNTTAAATAYQIQNDTLAGSFDRLKSAAESLGISIGEGLSPLIRGAVDLLTNLVLAVNKVPNGIKAMAAAFVAGVIGVNALTAALTAMGIASSAALGPLGLIIGGVAALAVGIAKVAENGQKMRVDELFSDTADELERAVRNGEDLSDAIERMSRETGLSVEQVINLAEEHGLVTDEIRTQIDLLRKEAQATGTIKQTAEDIADENAIIASEINDAARYMDDMSGWAADYAERMGYSLDRVVSIAQNSRVLTDEQKQQLVSLQAQVAEMQRQQDIANELSADSEKRLQNQERQNDIAERQADAAERVAAAEAEQLRLQQLRQQVEQTYLDVRAQVVKILDSEKTDMDRIREQIEYLNKHPWSPGFLENDRIEAIRILNEQLEALQQKLESERTARIEAAQKDLYDYVAERQKERDAQLADDHQKELARIAEEKNARIAAAQFAYATLTSIVNQAYSNQLQALENQKEAGLITEEQYAIKTAQIKRKQAAFDKATAIADATIAGAQAVIAAFKAGPILGPILAGVIGGLVATQIGLIVAQPLPEIPSFETGGIVPGNSFTGDRVVARVNSGEAILSQAQQAQLLSLANGAGAQGPVMLTVIQELNGKVIGQSTIDLLDNGRLRSKTIRFKGE